LSQSSLKKGTGHENLYQHGNQLFKRFSPGGKKFTSVLVFTTVPNWPPCILLVWKKT